MGQEKYKAGGEEKAKNEFLLLNFTTREETNDEENPKKNGVDMTYHKTHFLGRICPVGGTVVPFVLQK